MVGDLGLGKSLDMSSRLTMIAGTPTYVAPEQASAQAPDARADQYSLAALAFLLLTGRPPFTHTSLSDAMNPGDLPPVSTPERPFPPAVEQVLHRGLARDRDDRYPSVTEFVDALAAALGPVATGPATQPWLDRDPELTQPGPRPTVQPDSGDLPEPALPSRRGRRLAVLALVGLVALAVGGGAGYAAQRELAPTERTVTDENGNLSVTVPADWDRADATQGWTPPGSDNELSRPLGRHQRGLGGRRRHRRRVSSSACSTRTSCPTRCRSTRSATPPGVRSWTAGTVTTRPL